MNSHPPANLAPTQRLDAAFDFIIDMALAHGAEEAAQQPNDIEIGPYSVDTSEAQEAKDGHIELASLISYSTDPNSATNGLSA